jgi:hypothetical protein
MPRSMSCELPEIHFAFIVASPFRTRADLCAPASQQSGESSYQTDTQNQDDYPMMEGPDSPPDSHHLPIANHSVPVSGSQAAGGNRANGDTKVNHGAPGSSWNNKKWHEDYERAYTQILDQTWDHSEFDSLAFSAVAWD